MAEAASTSPGGQSVPAETLARLMNLTPRRVQQLAKEGVIPKAGRDQYPLAASIRAYCKYLQETEGDEGQIDPEKLTPFKRKAYYQAETAKLALMTERGELIPRIEVEDESGRVAKIVTHYLETILDIFERDYGIAPPILQRMQNDIDKIREQMAATMLAPPAPHADSPVRASA